MATADTEYGFLWWIEKYSYRHKYGQIISPQFVFDGIERTSWNLELFSIHRWSQIGAATLFLKRSDDDDGPETLSVMLEVSIIKVDGSALYSKQCGSDFRKGGLDYFEAYVDMDELFVRKNTDFLPRDTLGVRLRMWRGGRSAKKVKHYTARTVIGTEKVCFEHRIGNFSYLRRCEIKRVKIPSCSIEECVYFSDLWISFEGSIHVDAKSSVGHHRLVSKLISVIGVHGETRKLFDVDFRFTDADEKEDEMLQSLTTQFFVDRRSEFLPNDELTLLCECTFCTGEESSTVREIQAEKNDTKVVKQFDNPIASDIDQRDVFEKNFSSHLSALDEFKALYKDQILTNVQNKSATKSFSDDKTVVCARTSASRSMLSRDRKEGKTYCVKVDGPEDEIGRALILFYYSDPLKDLRWGSALEIYHYASTHGVESMKILSSYFLVDNLNTSNAGQLLLLVDIHSDKQLKEIIQNFILKHDEEVFCSEGWEKLGKTNPQLGMETMMLKYKREKQTK